MEDDIKDRLSSSCVPIFNSHPHKEDDTRWICILQGLRFFNSHPHKEDDHSWRYQQNHNMFSTHILTRRMTISLLVHLLSSVFQLTSSQGGWRAIMYAIFSNISFSTHILTRRMTFTGWSYIKDLCFQLTSSQGGWLRRILGNHWVFIFSTHILTRRMTVLFIPLPPQFPFQLTSSQGGWLFILNFCRSFYFFNSHPHKEDDCRVSSME